MSSENKGHCLNRIAWSVGDKDRDSQRKWQEGDLTGLRQAIYSDLELFTGLVNAALPARNATSG